MPHDATVISRSEVVANVVWRTLEREATYDVPPRMSESEVLTTKERLRRALAGEHVPAEESADRQDEQGSRSS